jgi:DNA-binding winged helix-turn-helix (wHTH) protein
MLRRFEGFEFDPETGEIRRGGESFRLEPQPARLLRCLLSRPGELISRDQAIRAVWADDTHVNFQEGLQYCVRQIRLALGDDGRQPRLLETIPRRGYRLLISATEVPQPRHAAWWPAAAVVTLGLIAITVAVERRPNRHHEIFVGFLRSVHQVLF